MDAVVEGRHVLHSLLQRLPQLLHCRALQPRTELFVHPGPRTIEIAEVWAVGWSPFQVVTRHQGSDSAEVACCGVLGLLQRIAAVASCAYICVGHTTAGFLLFSRS